MGGEPENTSVAIDNINLPVIVDCFFTISHYAALLKQFAFAERLKQQALALVNGIRVVQEFTAEKAFEKTVVRLNQAPSDEQLSYACRQAREDFHLMAADEQRKVIQTMREHWSVIWETCNALKSETIFCPEKVKLELPSFDIPTSIVVDDCLQAISDAFAKASVQAVRDMNYVMAQRCQKLSDIFAGAQEVEGAVKAANALLQ